MGMVILVISLASLAAYSKGNRKVMSISNKSVQAYYVAVTFTEGVKAFYADPTLVGGQTRFQTTYDGLGSNGTKDTVPSWVYYTRENVNYYPKITMTRIGNVQSTLILCRGRVVWDTLMPGVSPRSFTWGLVLNRPL